MRDFRHRIIFCYSLVGFVLGSFYATAPVGAQLLLEDDFDVAGNVNTQVWRLPFETEGTFVGRTEFRGDAAADTPQQGIAEPLATDGLVTEIYLDTYSPLDPGQQFLGTDLLTKRNFINGGGLIFEGRMRLKPSEQGGLVHGFFMFDVNRDIPAGSGNLVRDEIDFELVSNETVGAEDNRPFTNYWDDGFFNGPGPLEAHSVPGVDLTEFHDYKAHWEPGRIRWYVDDTLVRTATVGIPDDPMQLHLNLWAPNESFAEAYDATLQPTADESANERFTVQIDHIEVRRENTDVSENLLVDPSFEDFAEVAEDDALGGWRLFNRSFFEFDDPDGLDPNVPDMAADGITMLKVFGPFKEEPDASGAFQNVVAQPGDQLEGRVVVQTTGGDSIQGNDNFTLLSLAFLDDQGQVIQEAFDVPDGLDPADFMVDTNGKDTPLLDGRDPFLVEDEFVEGVVNAVAPDGTAMARLNLLFVQLNNEGGAAWFDDASLVRLSPAILFLLGDYNRDGTVNAPDYNVWRDSFGDIVVNGTGADGNSDGEINAPDYNVWRDNFGNSNQGQGLAVPEPATGTMMSLLCVMALLSSRTRSQIKMN